MNKSERSLHTQMNIGDSSKLSDDDVFSKLRQFLANRDSMNELLTDEERALILEASMRNDRLIDKIDHTLGV